MDALWSHVDVGHPLGCWEWTGPTTGNGYGRIYVLGFRERMAHRAAYALLIGPIPPGMELDHLCRNRRCVNPDHVEPVTPRENCMRGYSFGRKNADRSHCTHGHLLDEQNTYVRPNGHRDCRACIRERVRRYQARRQGVSA